MRLLVLRHAKAESPFGIDDLDRPLAPAGVSDARRLGRELADEGAVPSVVVVSPALRTRQTWQALSGGWTDGPEPVFDDDVYDASSRRLLQVVRERGGEAPSVLLIAHNPGVHDLVAVLARDRADVPLSYPPATLAVLDVDAARWADLAPATATVRRIRPPR